MNTREIERAIQALQEKQEELQAALIEQKQREAENATVFFKHTHAYYRQDRGVWVARWNSSPYQLKHIRQCGTKEEAVYLARDYDEVASFVMGFCGGE